MKTSCEKCCFAIFQDLQPESTETPVATQTGCRLGRLDKFKKVGTPVRTKLTDDNRFVYVIERLCLAARTSDWSKGLSDEEKVKKVREELRLACHVYVPAIAASPEDIEKTLDSLVGQNLKPVAAEVLVSGRHRPGPLILRLQERYADKLVWKLTVVNADTTTPDEAIDKAVLSCQAPFYSVFHAGSEAPATFLADLDKAINDDLLTFAVVTGDEDDNGLVVVREMHNRLGGNATVDMVEGDPEQMTEEELANAATVAIHGIENKVRFLAEKVGLPHLVVEGRAVCPTA